MKDSNINIEKVGGDYKLFRIILGITFILITIITFINYSHNIKQLAGPFFSFADNFIRQFIFG